MLRAFARCAAAPSARGEAPRRERIALEVASTLLLGVAALKSFFDLGAFGWDPFSLAFDAWGEEVLPRFLLYAAVVGGTRGAAGGARASGLGPCLLLPAAHLLAFAYANLETAAWFHEHRPAAAFAAISILWGVWSAGYLVAGFLAERALARRAAIALFFLAACKVVLFDLQNASTPYRIASFLGVGLLLVGASYLYHRLAKRLVRGE